MIVMKRSIPIFLVSLAFLASSLHSITAQTPTHVPGPGGEPVVFNLTNIIVFIIVPVALFVFYIWWERSKARERREKEQKKMKDND
jgi:heme/copper-type cytochrome/quinol oxidase subunit 2